MKKTGNDLIEIKLLILVKLAEGALNWVRHGCGDTFLALTLTDGGFFGIWREGGGIRPF